ncbi:hypothetical protein PROFUN_06876 [Planoprotostelium fungivorum]|uniref:Uncharacterized protein n=1 Tax=Planoprotostelium fungivorum TaxID=1890364 RepID=A0A2P6NMS6_9EUKA|nr:hypothetical protein PROFUN_06876 [Planoprotostelium fungivorum]
MSSPILRVSDFRRNLKEHVTRSSRIHGSTEFVAEGLDRQDSIIETKGRDRQSLNKIRTPHHWGQDKGKRSITGTKTKRQLKINNQQTGLDCQDSIIETKGRDRQSLNKTRTPHHWGQDKGERSITGTKTERQIYHWDQDKETGIGMGEDEEFIDMDTAQFGRLIHV